MKKIGTHNTLYEDWEDLLTCSSPDSDYDGLSSFEKISEGLSSKGKSKLMFMRDGELWDWGLNEKVKIPTKNSGCLEISAFIRFIETRKF